MSKTASDQSLLNFMVVGSRPRADVEVRIRRRDMLRVLPVMDIPTDRACFGAGAPCGDQRHGFA